MEKQIYNDIAEKISKVKRYVFTDKIIPKDIPLRYEFVSWNQNNYIYIQMRIVLTDADEELQKVFMKCISKIKRNGNQCTYIMDRNGYFGVRFLYYY
jgi:hypothetical protein